MVRRHPYAFSPPFPMRRALRMFVLVLLLLCPIVTASAEILVLQSHDSTPYQAVLEGFKATLAQLGINAGYTTKSVKASVPAANGILPQLVLALGTPAVERAQTLPNSPPTLAALVLDGDKLTQTPNISGVMLNFPATTHWLWLKRLLPSAGAIAVFHPPNDGQTLLNELQNFARRDGIELLPHVMPSSEDLPAVLQSLPSHLDALWVLKGSPALNPSMIKALLLYSFQNRIPLIGLSEQWVIAGALYALDWDYHDLGAQAAETAVTVLHAPGKPLPPLQTPRKVRPVINPRTWEHMKLSMPTAWQADVVEVAP